MIYFMRDEATQFIKIGVTINNAEDRRRTLQTGCPGNLTLLLEMEGSEQDETAWHERFASVRERGEWFRPVPELLLAIMEAKVMQLEAENSRLLELLAAEKDQTSTLKGQLRSLKTFAHSKADRFTEDGVYRFIPREKDK
ncbi:MAG: GIY-YIG nuclease family protein [Planctomycetes bacterium]|nr:GIY-YIG nuclease family protein [Planctomycetota bacterium]MBU4398076.1 GIY-YIG nuclease family protein [Planctomycetota bacterium]MCG2685683.1 GIY-YIG nuclease family protein [Planctomycetales bacterium]